MPPAPTLVASSLSDDAPHGPSLPTELTAAPQATLNGSDSGTAGNKKKRKKKKGKGKMTAMDDEEYAYTAMNGIIDELRDAQGQLSEAFSEPFNHSHTHSRTLTGLSPDLESVHFSTTQTLTSLASPTGRDTPSYSMDQAEMLAELYRNVNIDLSTTKGNFNFNTTADSLKQASDEVRESMSSLSGTMQQFVQTALTQMADLGLSDSDWKQRSIQSIAKEMLDNGIGVGIGVGVGAGPNGRPAGRGVADASGLDASRERSGGCVRVGCKPAA